jgi:hypothetical protein
MRESIEPEDGEKYHLQYHLRRVEVNGACVIGASGPFLGSADGTFNVWHVFIFATDVQFGTQVGGHCAPGAFKFAIAKDVGNYEAAFAVYSVDSLEGLDE